jgi:hypothetical protein
MASSRSSASVRPVKLAMRGGTPTKVRPLRRWERSADERLRRRQDAALALFGIGDADQILIDNVSEEAS